MPERGAKIKQAISSLGEQNCSSPQPLPPSWVLLSQVSYFPGKHQPFPRDWRDEENPKEGSSFLHLTGQWGSTFLALSVHSFKKKEKDAKKKKRFKLFIGRMSLCWYISVVFCMGLVSVHVKAPHGCLFMAGAVLCWQSLPSWHRLTRQTPGGKPTPHHSLSSVSTNGAVAALRLSWRNSPSLK